MYVELIDLWVLPEGLSGRAFLIRVLNKSPIHNGTGDRSVTRTEGELIMVT